MQRPSNKQLQHHNTPLKPPATNFAGGFFVNICHIYENKIIDITKTQNGKGCCHFDWKH